METPVVRKGQGDGKLTRDEFQPWLRERFFDPEFQTVMIVTPVYWYQAPIVRKLMMDRLVCADGGHPDQTSTHGKKPEEAKARALNGWHYPRHLAGRVFSVVVHGDTVGAETLRRSLTNWLTDMKLLPAMTQGGIDRYIGYYEPSATSHDALDKETAVQQEVRNAAKALVDALALSRAGRFPHPDAESDPRPK